VAIRGLIFSLTHIELNIRIEITKRREAMWTLVSLAVALLWRGEVSIGKGAVGAYLDRIFVIISLGYAIWLVLALLFGIMILWFRFRRISYEIVWLDAVLAVALLVHRTIRVFVFAGIATLWGSMWYGAVDVGIIFLGSMALDFFIADFLRSAALKRGEKSGIEVWVSNRILKLLIWI
jgi:hypothetical protein